jgi:hypothetical protein
MVQCPAVNTDAILFSIAVQIINDAINIQISHQQSQMD